MDTGNLKRFISERLSKTKFSCVSCGRCCKNRGIELNLGEIKKIASYLDLSISEFMKNYVETRNIDRIKKSIQHDYHIKKQANFLKITRDDGICVFNEIKEGISRCKIYPVRPNICQLFPFTWEYIHEKGGIYIDFSDNAWENCKGISEDIGENWGEIRESVTSIVIISLINALNSGGIKKI